jgi:hypothetical protein
VTDAAALTEQHAELLRQIAAASDEVFSTFHRLAPAPPVPDPLKHRAIVMDSVEVGESVSHAAWSLIGTGSVHPALALARVRLEQIIVMSYLILENPDVGFKAYAAFAPITEYRTAEAVLSDDFLSPRLQDRIKLDELKAKALSAQTEINPGFDLVAGKLQSKWTALDLYSMALRRDTLISNSHFVASRLFPLAAVYIAIYKTASSVVHADGSALGFPFRGTGNSADRSLTIDAATFWKLALPPHLVTFDFIQCYEALKWAGVNCDREFLSIAKQLA